MDDREIVELFLARSQQAIAATELKYGTYCRRIAQRILERAEDSEECVNDTWLSLWEAIPPAEPENLKAFAGRIARNLALNRRRAWNAQKRGGGVVELALEELGDCIAGGNLVEEHLESRELSRAIDGFLSGLSRKKRVVFVLRYWHFRSISEISAQTGIRQGTVKSILCRLRRELKHCLEQEGLLQ